jgi:hypothetical protein
LQLPNLKRLWLNDTEITDDGLEMLANSQNLKVLELTNTATTDAAVAKLQSSLPAIEIIRTKER